MGKELGGVAVILIESGGVLLTLRKVGGNVGKWELPAGHLKEGETYQEAAVREVSEETGLQIRDVTLAEVFTDASFEGPVHICTATIFGGSLENLEPTKHDEVKWWPLDGLPDPLGPSAQRGLSAT